MWLLLGFLCGYSLLSCVQGNEDLGVLCTISEQEIQKAWRDKIIGGGILEKQLKLVQLPNLGYGGGLLGSLLSVTNLRIFSIQFFEISVKLKPNLGSQLIILLKLNVDGNCLLNLLSGLINISVDLRLNVDICLGTFSKETIQFVPNNCSMTVGAINVNLLSGLLPIQAQMLIGNSLRGMLPCLICPVAKEALVQTTIQMFNSINSLAPLGTLGTIRYTLAGSPAITGQTVDLNIIVAVRLMEGGSVNIPANLTPVALPRLDGYMVSLGIHQSFLSVILSILINLSPPVFTCNQEMFSECNQLKNAIFPLIPSSCSPCPSSSPLIVKLVLSERPLILLEDGKATVKLFLIIQLFLQKAHNTFFPLMVLKADLFLKANFVVSGCKLMISLSLESISLSLSSSSVGSIQVSGLNPVISKLLEDLFVPSVNGAGLVGFGANCSRIRTCWPPPSLPT
uniref:BPI fold-containing family B member 4-like isoform X2 n=1 Tax=Phascolarctos cinereus TaxID=38626 RepID=A0A6P5KML0_PHACI|nr:BPI fold-containing family B member 4-like isoform X2 [Phascolarctos cinereus]